MEKVQDYILNPAELTPVATAAAKPARKSNITYKPVVENGLDLVIERKSTRGTKIAAFIITQEQFYIKDEHGNTQIMDAENLSKFLASSGYGIRLENTCWITELQKGKAFSESLLNFLQNYTPLIKEGLASYKLFESTSGGGRYRSSMLKELSEMDQKALKLVTYAMNKASEITGLDTGGVLQRTQTSNSYNSSVGFLEEPLNSLSWLELVEKQYGIDNAKKMIDAFAESNLAIGGSFETYVDLLSTVDRELYAVVRDAKENWDRNYRYGRRFRSDEVRAAVLSYFSGNNFKHNKECFEFNRMLRYMLTYQLEGFGNLRDFMSTWYDTLKNQIEIYAKVKDRYPENLLTEHNRTMLKANAIAKIKQFTDFKDSYEKAKDLAWETGDYIFVVPETPEDMVEEAFNQSNCLRSYIPDVAEGRKRIVFMRKASQPDVSLITIEVTANDRVGQVKGRHNRNATSSEMTAVRRWAEEKELIL